MGSSAQTPHPQPPMCLLSNVGDTDPMEHRFRAKFNNFANLDLIPGLGAQKTYQFYVWKQGIYGHWSIVIGCNSRADTGFVTIELRVDLENKRIHPDCSFIPRIQGEEYIKNKKWIQDANKSWSIPQTFADCKYECKTTMEALIQIALESIQDHGKYDIVVNSCQDFVGTFLFKMNQIGDTPIPMQSTEVALVSTAVGASIGGSIGYAGGGKPLAKVGYLCGGIIGEAGALYALAVTQKELKKK